MTKFNKGDKVKILEEGTCKFCVGTITALDDISALIKLDNKQTNVFVMDIKNLMLISQREKFKPEDLIL